MSATDSIAFPPSARTRIAAAAAVTSASLWPRSVAHMAMLAMGVAAIQSVLPSISWAQTTPAPAARHAETAQNYQVAAGPLGAALRQFASQAGVLLSFTEAQTDGLQSHGIDGLYSHQTALAALLANTGLKAVLLHNGGYVLQPSPVSAPSSRGNVGAGAVLDEVVVTGNAKDSGTSYAAAQLGIGGMAMQAKEIPQTVSVMTRQRMEDQQLNSLRDVVEQAPGVTTTQSSSVTNAFYSRGFEITNIKVDGGTGLYHGYQFNALPDSVLFEQVEVLRGADTLFSGSGEPGGAINLVRKRPTKERQVDVMVSAGSWNTKRGDLDVSGPLTEDGRLRARAVASYRDSDTFQSHTSSDARLLYGIVEWDATPSTMLTLGASLDRRHDPFVNFGLPRYATGANLNLPRSTYLAGGWSHFNRDINTVFAKLDQAFSERWSLTFNAMHVGQKDQRSGVGWATGIDANGRGGTSTPAQYHYSADQTTLDLSLKGSFDLLGRSHDLLAGANWQNVKSTAFGSRSPTRYTIEDIFQFNPDDYANPNDYVPFFDYPNYGIRQSGLFAVARLQMTDRAKLIVGARHSRYEYDYVYRDLGATGLPTTESITHFKETGITTPYGGVTYDLNADWTAYASYAQTYKSQAGNLKGPLPGTPLDPITGRNLEVGLKGSVWDGRLDVSAAVYHIKRNGQAIRDSDYPATVGDLGSNCCWLDNGRIVSQGIDLEASGEIASGWLASAGYTYNSNRNKVATSRYSSITPRHLFKAFSSVQLPGQAAAWRLGGGVNIQSATYVNGTAAVLDANGQPTGTNIPFQFREPGRAVWDLFAEYRINSQWTAALNVRNLFDKTYYQTVGTSGYGNWYGEPRNVMLSLRGRF